MTENFFPEQSPQMAQGVNAGAVTIESMRAVAEVRGQIQLAKMFPRDLNAAYRELMDACRIPALADVAFYTLPRGNSKISGPTIRLAEEIARVYGNFEFGHRELGRHAATANAFGYSEIEVFAWDKQTNNRSIRQITVEHSLDVGGSTRALKTQADIDNKIANVASKQLRGRILSMMPKWLVESAIQECTKTLAGSNEVPLSERVRRAVDAFGKIGVSLEQIEAAIGKPSEQFNTEDLVDLTGFRNMIKEGAAIDDVFPPVVKDEKTALELSIAKGNENQKAAAATVAAPAFSRDGVNAKEKTGGTTIVEGVNVREKTEATPPPASGRKRAAKPAPETKPAAEESPKDEKPVEEPKDDPRLSPEYKEEQISIPVVEDDQWVAVAPEDEPVGHAAEVIPPAKGDEYF